MTVWLGFRQMVGLGNLAIHERQDSEVMATSFVDKAHVELRKIEPEGRKQDYMGGDVKNVLTKLFLFDIIGLILYMIIHINDLSDIEVH